MQPDDGPEKPRQMQITRILIQVVEALAGLLVGLLIKRWERGEL